MFQSHVQLHRFALALNSERNNIAGVRVRREQIRELDLAVKRVHVVAVLIDFIVRDCSHDVAHLESRFHSWCPWLDSSYINSARVLLFFSGELTQRGIARRRERSEEHTSELQSLAYLVCRL